MHFGVDQLMRYIQYFYFAQFWYTSLHTTWNTNNYINVSRIRLQHVANVMHKTDTWITYQLRSSEVPCFAIVENKYQW